MLSRRRFLAAVPAALAVAGVQGRTAFSAARVKLGCQTNAWRIDPADFNQVLGVLRQLKALGFDGFETGFRNVQGQFGNAAAARKQIEQTGLQFFGTHIFLDQYDQTFIPPLDLITKIAEGAAHLGAQRLIVSGRGQRDVANPPANFVEIKAAALNRAGAVCRKLGLRFAYHNHGPEFAKPGTNQLTELEALVRQTDPAQVDFLLDAGWALHAGANVPAFFAQQHRRLIGMHLRDFKAGEQVPLGQGEFPLKELAATIERVQWMGWVLNEEERLSGEKPGERAVAPARQSLRQVFGK